MFIDATNDDFLHVHRTHEGDFVIVEKDQIREWDRHVMHVVSKDFEFSKEYTELAKAKAMCEKILEIMGVKTYYKEHKLALVFEIVKLDKSSHLKPVN